METKINKLTGAVALGLWLTNACAPIASEAGAESDRKMMMQSHGKAADLRTGLNILFAEHVSLAASATGAALGGRDAEFKAAAGALDANSIAISKAIGSVYGAGRAEQ